MLHRLGMWWHKMCVYCLMIKIKIKINKWGGRVGDQFWDS